MTISAAPATALALTPPKNPAPTTGQANSGNPANAANATTAGNSGAVSDAANSGSNEATPQSFSAVFARLAKPASTGSASEAKTSPAPIDASAALRQFFEAARTGSVNTAAEADPNNPLAAFFSQNKAARSATGVDQNHADGTEPPQGDLAQWLAALGLPGASNTATQTAQTTQTDPGLAALARTPLAGAGTPTATDAEIASEDPAQDAAHSKAERPFAALLDEAGREPATVSADKAAPASGSATATDAQASLAATTHSTNNAAATSAGQHLHAAQAGATGAATSAAGTATASTTNHLHLGSRVGSPDWAGELGQKIVWLAGNERQTAHLTLNPANLGPLEISINLSREQASAVFVSAHAEVREALENALPRLREMFAGAGIELGQSQVNSQSQRQQDASSGNQGGRNQANGGHAHSGELGSAGSSTLTPSQSRSGNGLVDMFV